MSTLSAVRRTLYHLIPFSALRETVHSIFFICFYHKLIHTASIALNKIPVGHSVRLYTFKIHIICTYQNVHPVPRICSQQCGVNSKIADFLRNQYATGIMCTYCKSIVSGCSAQTVKKKQQSAVGK